MSNPRSAVGAGVLVIMGASETPGSQLPLAAGAWVGAWVGACARFREGLGLRTAAERICVTCDQSLSLSLSPSLSLSLSLTHERAF